jgi:integrase
MNVKRRTVKGQRAYTDAEVHILLEQDGPQEGKDLTMVGLYSGCRPGEIVDALAKDFDGTLQSPMRKQKQAIAGSP